MTKTLIGLDYTGTACVKITKGSYDPVTTPDSDISKFLYSSKWAADCKIADLFRGVLPTGSGYYPSSGAWKYFIAYGHPRPAGDGSEVYPNIIQRGYFERLIYDYPLHIIKSYDANGYDITTRVWEAVLGSSYSNTYLWQTANASYNNVGWCNAGAYYGVFAANSYVRVTTTQTSITSMQDLTSSSLITLAVFNLPGDQAAVDNGVERAPVGGQPQILINPSTLKVSKPGFDVNTATGTQVAFDSANVPSKIIAANDIAVPSGTSYYDTGFALTLETLVDCHFYDSAEIYFPRSIAKGAIPVVYRKNGTRIEFVNSGSACRARFMVYASGSTDQTTGVNDVLKQFTDGSGNNVVQFLRPGASASPSYSDIVIDSRWPVVKIVKEGYFDVPRGPAETDISYNSSGMFTFIKWCTVHGGGSLGTSNATRWEWSKFVRPPEFTLYAIDNGPFSVGGNTTICRYNDSNARFYSYRGMPKYVRYSSSNPTNVYDSAEMLGIRYFVFGVAIP